MEMSKIYLRVFFPFAVIREADRLITEGTDPKSCSYDLQVSIGMETWSHDTVDEFAADYRRDPAAAYYSLRAEGRRLSISWHSKPANTFVSVEATNRSFIAAIHNVFESARPNATLPDPPPEPRIKPRIFIGHGGSPLWRELKDHLQDKHSVRVEAYEVGSRAGHTIRDVLEDVLDRSSMALLVLTAEDETADGHKRARQNVVHETGLFQGRLGFNKAIVLLEDGAEEFSNLYGIQQIRFAKGNIKETFGDVLAAIHREFPSAT
jgi:predicted nucleotide-binding protein